MDHLNVSITFTDFVAEHSYSKWQLVFAETEHENHFLLKVDYTFSGCFLYLCMTMTIYFVKFYLQLTLTNPYISQPFPHPGCSCTGHSAFTINFSHVSRLIFRIVFLRPPTYVETYHNFILSSSQLLVNAF